MSTLHLQVGFMQGYNDGMQDIKMIKHDHFQNALEVAKNFAIESLRLNHKAILLGLGRQEAADYLRCDLTELDAAAAAYEMGFISCMETFLEEELKGGE